MNAVPSLRLPAPMSLAGFPRMTLYAIFGVKNKKNERAVCAFVDHPNEAGIPAFVEIPEVDSSNIDLEKPFIIDIVPVEFEGETRSVFWLTQQSNTRSGSR